MAINSVYGCDECVISIECENAEAQFIPPCAKLADKNLTDLQQLRANVYALADKLSGTYGFETDVHVRCIVDEMRQLSEKVEADPKQQLRDEIAKILRKSNCVYKRGNEGSTVWFIEPSDFEKLCRLFFTTSETIELVKEKFAKSEQQLNDVVSRSSIEDAIKVLQKLIS